MRAQVFSQSLCVDWSDIINAMTNLRIGTNTLRTFRGRVVGLKNRLLRAWRMPQDVLARLAPEGALPMESAAATAGAGTAEAQPVHGSLAKLLSTHILRDGEVILLALKPSIWFIPLSGLRLIATIILAAMIARILDDQRTMLYVEIAIFLVAGRLVWSLLQWMGRLYILTDLRILSLSGIFSVDVFDCPLRKVARARLLYIPRERVLRLGSLEIIPSDEAMPSGIWQTISRPGFVYQQVLAAIRRAKHPGLGFNAA